MNAWSVTDPKATGAQGYGNTIGKAVYRTSKTTKGVFGINAIDFQGEAVNWFKHWPCTDQKLDGWSELRTSCLFDFRKNLVCRGAPYHRTCLGDDGATEISF